MDMRKRLKTIGDGLHWKLEIVYANFGKKYFTAEEDEEEPNEIERMFPGLHTIRSTRFYWILTTDLEGPLTEEQKYLLTQAKSEGNIIDFCARQTV